MASVYVLKKTVLIVLLAFGAKLIHEKESSWKIIDKCREHALYSIETFEEFFGLTTKPPPNIFDNELLLYKYSFVLITGGSGYVGFHAAREMVNRGLKYILVMDSVDNYESLEYANKRIEILEGVGSVKVVNKTACDYKTLSEIYSKYKFSHILHLSSYQNNDQLDLVNKTEENDCFENVLKLLASLKEKEREILPHLTYTSSPSRQKSTNSNWKTNEQLARSYFESHGIVSIGLQISKVYGTWGNLNSFPFSYAESIMNQKPIRISDDLEENYVFIRDLVEGILEAMQFKSSESEMFTLANHKNTKLRKAVQIVEERLNTKGKVESTPSIGEKFDFQFPIEKAQKLLKFKATTELTNGLNQFLDWYLMHKNLTTFCASDCALKNDLPCLKSSYDEVIRISSEISKHCELVVYTVSIGKNLKNLLMPKVNLLGKNKKSCYFAFVSDSSPFYQSHKTSYGYWRLIPIRDKDYQITARKFSRIPKITPNIFFHEHVKYAIYVDAKMELLVNPIQLAKNIELKNGEKALMVGFRHPLTTSLSEEYDLILTANRSQLLYTLKQQRDQYLEIGTVNSLSYSHVIEASILLHNLHSSNAKMFRCKWLREYLKGADRDQLVFPYLIDTMAHQIGERLSAETELCPVAMNKETKKKEYIRIMPKSYHWINNKIALEYFGLDY